jgi:hypothetical protein
MRQRLALTAGGVNTQTGTWRQLLGCRKEANVVGYCPLLTMTMKTHWLRILGLAPLLLALFWPATNLPMRLNAAVQHL